MDTGMRVAVVGTGGVGGYFGGRLAAAGTDVHFLARGRHLRALQERGLRLRSVHGDRHLPAVSATDDAAAVGACDLVLFCVKSFDTDEAATAHLPHLVAEHTAVLVLQNGIDNHDRIAERVGRRHVLGGVALIFSTIAEPGVINHTGGPARVLLGELDGTSSRRTERILATFHAAGIDAAIPADIRTSMWDKFAFICAQAGTTAAVRKPIGDIRDTPPTWKLLRTLLEECYAVARGSGVPVADDAVEERLRFAASLEPGSFSSLHHDLVSGRRMELEALHGTVLRLARAHDVPVPVTEALYAVLAPWDRAARASAPART